MMRSLSSLDPITVARGAILIGGLVALWLAADPKRWSVAPIGAVLLAAMFATTVAPAAFDFCRAKPRAEPAWGSPLAPRAGAVAKR